MNTNSGKHRELPLSQWAEKDGVLYWCGGYAPDSLVGVYLSKEQKKRKLHNDKILHPVRYAV